MAQQGFEIKQNIVNIRDWSLMDHEICCLDQPTSVREVIRQHRTSFN